VTSQIQLKNDESLKQEKSNIFVKKVILENFLSFQRDEVDFGESKFVIIVGPNWSGKTSIFQAIKFALGSNERDDRYTKWSNFIRNGQNHAMVEIHIQKGEDLIQLRRYVVRGQSPYFMIKTKNEQEFHKAQVHDIQDLINHININPDNHFAFVSQGKIDAVKNLKPTDLCSFLEDGIGLKPLRDEIITQKNSVLSLDNDLTSMKVRRNTLSTSLDLLTPKLNRLKQKNKLLTIREKYNDELLWANRDKLEKDINKLEEIIENLKQVIKGIKSRKEKNDNEIKILNSKILIEEGNINKLTKTIGELSFQKTDFVSKIQNWQKEKIITKQELEQISNKLREIEKIITNYEKQEESIENELQIIKREQKKLETKIEGLIKEQERLVSKIKQNKIVLAEYNKIDEEKKIRKTRIQDNQALILSITDEINQLFQSYKDIEHKLENNKWFLENPSKSLLQEVEKELRNISLKIYDIDSDIQKLESEKSKRIKKLKMLQTSLRERRVILPSNISILREEIERRDLRVKGPLIEYLKYEDALSYAIESVLGEKLLYSFVAEDWETLTLLKKLKAKYNAYCNIYLPKKLEIIQLPPIVGDDIIGYLAQLITVVDDDKDIKKVIYSKVKNCLVVKDYHSGRQIYNKIGFKGKCVTLAGEQIISYKYVYETPYVKRLKGLLSAATQKEQSKVLESEIESINESISELRVKQSKLDSILKENYKKKDTFNDLLYNFNQKQRITTKKNQLYEQIHNLEKQNSEFEKDLKDLDVKIIELKSQTDPDFFKWSERINEIPKELITFNKENKKWEEKLEENSGILKEVKLEINKQKIELKGRKVNYEKKKEDFQKADKTAFEIYKQLENVEESLEKIEKEINESKESKLQCQNRKNEIDRRGIEITLNLEQENIKLNTFNQEFLSKRNNFERINSEIGSLISGELIVIRPIEDINEDILEIDKRLLKFLDVDDSLLIEKDQIMSSLKEINRRQEDLENDIKAAIRTEKKLEKTYYEKYSTVLSEIQSKVNQKFKYSQIKSFCSLELKGDFENLGVDIRAATSKEQLKSFTALSGGQVSLISICLILSLQEIKPSPLCMLDEAGMFLDEKNSEVAYQLIKSTLERNPIQLLMFLPKTSSSLFLLAEKIIGIARVGKNEISSVFKPKIIKKK
jgi:chromosome segregation protein